MVENQTTEDKILSAAIDLMEQKGYKAVTIKEIAQVAGFSEMTLFRRFGSKKAILDAAVEKYSYNYCMKQIFEEQITYDIEHDLALIARTYQKYMNRNRKIVMLAFQERHFHPEIGQKTAENPRQLKEYLLRYLTEMKERGKINGTNLEATAMTFLWMNLGFFMAQFVAGNEVSPVGLDEFIESSVKLFVS
ncbi:TetR/AcrR family transcriptional regulator [Anaerobacillus alkaliphilus]|uniref:TetR/AcrR family transcriptional regulator n=1 Tax=Anaerobacillus alkaliphilus TaxID=1548597 RepID=A0A4Q0VTB2_9BACI|nr:TetR/AcrR family transcriptional regulator [Anaerobacillus alkaliphilus]RXJ01653.1 TetR/AcrR family transcriptional regulator [Anaerobacillus alkaliphilus]